MDNNYLNARLKRDADTAAGLLADQPNYQPLEDDIKPLRDEHAANLDKAKALEDLVLADGQDDSTAQKVGARNILKPLAGRLAAALQAHAASATNKDEKLASRVNFNATTLGDADDQSFATIVAALHKEAQPLPKELAKREFTAHDLATVEAQLKRFTKKRTGHRLAVVDGSTARKTLIGLLKRNADLIKQLRVQFKPYQNSPTRHEVWERFQGYTKIIAHKGGGSKKRSGEATT